jgi:hypothetical protein
MVRPAANRRGRGTLGCLVPLVLLGLLLFVGIKFGRPWFAYQQFRDEMSSVAKFATTLSDSAMRARLMARADSLRLPTEAKDRLQFTRLGDPPRIHIETEYSATVVLPLLGPKVLHFRPTAEASL